MDSLPRTGQGGAMFDFAEAVAHCRRTDARAAWFGSGRPRALIVYLAIILIGNLAWEALALPLYTIWTTGSFREQAVAVLHCTAGGVLIARSALLIALRTAGCEHWAIERFGPVLLVATIFSDWVNIEVRSRWAYSPLMPVVPLVGVGVSPLMQRIVLPALASRLTRCLAAGRPTNLAP
jgi:hypothetical protein